jgi:cytochrome c oxidase subunit 2
MIDYLPSSSSTMSAEVDALFNFIFYTASIFFAIVLFSSVYFVLKYRRRQQNGLTSGLAHNTKLEIVWTVIPTILVFIVFIWGFRSYLRLHVAPRDALEIKVTGQKWFWTFDYPGGANSLNELYVPVGKPVKLLMSSQDVIHSFYVPDFRIKMDVLPNRYTITWFEATRTGDFQIFCTEYCGKGHSEMLGKVKVVPDSAYTAWLERSSNDLPEGISLSDAGAQLYQSKACITCHTVDGTAGIAPSFKGRLGKVEQMTNGQEVLVDENYLRESILNPQAKVVKGFQPVMPTFQGVLKDRQIDALITYIKSLQDQTQERPK